MNEWDTAIDVIQHRHAKYGLVVYAEDGERFCALGAVGVALYGEEPWVAVASRGSSEQYRLLERDSRARQMIDCLAEEIREQYPDMDLESALDMMETVYVFNDNKDTTVEDLLAVFEKARIRDEEMIK